MIRPIALLLLLLVACARELELPEAPTPIPDGPPAPALLGALSGDYELEVALEFDGVMVPAPAGWLRLMHLVDPRGVDAERVLGYGLLANAFDQVDDGTLSCAAFLDATYDGRRLQGTAQTFTCEGLAGDRLPFAAQPVAGVAGLSSDLPYFVCPDSPARPLRARRRCVFNPSISGVYQGTATDCDGVSFSTQLALGFAGAELVGFGHPWSESIYSGRYEPFDFGGTLQIEEPATGRLECAAFTLVPDGDVVRLSLQRWPAAEERLDDGTILQSCAERPEACAGLTVEATRLVAGDEAPCEAADFAPALWVYTQPALEGTERYLDVFVIDGNGSGGVLPPFTAQIVLQRPSDGAHAEQVQGPETVTGRFRLGDACDVDATNWELFASVGAFEGGEQSVAPVICVVDAPAARSGAREGEPCVEPFATDGVLTCIPYDDGDPAVEDPAVWSVYCETSASCSSAGQLCLAAIGFPVCVPNGCGISSLGGPDDNGAPLGPCDAARGQLGPEGPVEAGRCLGGEEGAMCFLGGELPFGAACKADAPRRTSELCVDGAFCVADPPARARPCRCDADCGGEAVPSACSAARGVCEPLGRCLELCDAGSAPVEPGSFGDCETAGTSCHATDGGLVGAHALGLCW